MGLGICAFCYMLNIFNVVVFHRSVVHWRSPSGIICAFCYMWNLFSQGYSIQWSIWGQDLPCICAFCYMWNFIWCKYSIHLWSIGVRGTSVYECILLFLNIFGVIGQLEDGALVSMGQLDLWGGGTSALCIMCILLYVKRIQCVIFHTISVGGAPQGTLKYWIHLYVKLLWCSSIPYIYGQLEGGTSGGLKVYVHSAISETYSDL